MAITQRDLPFLRRCVALATEALEAGDEPFGSVLVSAGGEVLAEDRNREHTTGDPTAHPEIALARWAAVHLDAIDRPAATVYTSGEHCPMCAAAHGWVGLGRIAFVHSSAQLADWLGQLGVGPAPVRPYAITDIVREIVVDGPVPELAEEMYELHRRFRGANPPPG